MKEKTIDYSFDNGLVIMEGDKTVLRIAKEELLEKASKMNSAELPKPPASYLAKWCHGDKTGAVELYLFNKDKPGVPIVMFYPWGEAYAKRIIRGESERLARSLDRPIVFVEQSGFGKSSVIPKTVQREIKKSGSFMAMGKLLAKPLAQYLREELKADEIHICGCSQGGRVALAAACYLEGINSTVSIVDPPGMTPHNALSLLHRFCVKEGLIHSRKYLKHARRITEHGAMSLISLRDTTSPAYIRQSFFSFPMAFRKACLTLDIAQAARNAKMICVVALEKSELNAFEDWGRSWEGIKNTRILSIPKHTHMIINCKPAIRFLITEKLVQLAQMH